MYGPFGTNNSSSASSVSPMTASLCTKNSCLSVSNPLAVVLSPNSTPINGHHNHHSHQGNGVSGGNLKSQANRSKGRSSAGKGCIGFYFFYLFLFFILFSFFALLLLYVRILINLV